MNKGISSAPGLTVHSCEHWENSVWLAHWSVHLLYLNPFLIFMLFRLCQFYNNAHWPGQDYSVRFTVRDKSMTPCDLQFNIWRCWGCQVSKLVLLLGHYSTLFNKWMDGMKSLCLTEQFKAQNNILCALNLQIGFFRSVNVLYNKTLYLKRKHGHWFFIYHSISTIQWI